MELKRKRPEDHLLLVKFKDEKGEEYTWAPKWEEIDRIYATCFVTENLNGARGLDSLMMVDKLRGDKALREAVERAQEEIDVEEELVAWLRSKDWVVIWPEEDYDIHAPEY